MNITSKELHQALINIEADSNKTFQFKPNGYRHDIFVLGIFNTTMRRSKLLGFCDGWFACKDTMLKENPVYRGMSIQSGVYHVLRQLTDAQIMAAGDPINNEDRGFAALHAHLDANLLLPFATDKANKRDNNFGFDQEALNFYNVLISEITKVICNIWDYRMRNKHFRE